MFSELAEYIIFIKVKNLSSLKKFLKAVVVLDDISIFVTGSTTFGYFLFVSKISLSISEFVINFIGFLSSAVSFFTVNVVVLGADGGLGGTIL